MNRPPCWFVLLLTTLALLVGCGPTIQATPPTLAPAPTAVPAPTDVPAAAVPEPTTAPAPTAAPAAMLTTAELATRLDDYFTARTEDSGFSGSVLIMRGDEVVLRKGYGYADQEAQTPNTPETVYRIGNLTRPLTAMAILMLESEGKLSVEDSICAYLDDCPEAWEPITLHHLLSDSSGIPNFTDATDFEQVSASPVTPADLIAFVRDADLRFESGERWDLSHTNYVLLGMVIERVSGQDYAAFMQERIFTPLDMNATGYLSPPPTLAIGYEDYYDGTTPAPFDASAAYAAYGLFSTVDDLYRWNRALFGDELLSQAQREKMHSVHVLLDPIGFGYATPLDYNGVNSGGHPVAEHGVWFPSYPGYYSSHWTLTDLDTTTIILSNQVNWPFDRTEQVVRIIVTEQ
jgi:CubicO group peptidase (beta-lactamase class C family)